MGIFSSPIKSLEDLFNHTLHDIYYAEQQITKNLPTMAEKAKNPELKAAFTSHLRETEQQLQRLEQIFQKLGQDAKGVECKAINGILAETKEIISDSDNAEVCDAAMLAAAQAVEHYEIARYGTLIDFATRLGHRDVVTLLEATLKEEKSADQKLTGIATSRVNQQAA